MIAGLILERAGLLLSDTGFERWSRAALLGFLNEAVRQVVLVRPDASAVVETVLLAAGTRQSLPSGAVRLLGILRNMGPDGLTPGRPVRLGDLSAQNAADPEWHAGQSAAAISEYFYDLRTPSTYYVRPPASESPPVHLEIAYTALPPVLASEEDDLGLDEMYAGPLLDWTLYRAFHADTESAAGRARAETHFKAFYQSLDRKTQSDVAVAPANRSSS